MCGIAAIFAYSSDAPGVDPGELVAIRDHMIARGPDGSGSWISPDGRVGLAHRRLSILDLSEAGAQPMWNVEGTLGITFNGEIYNYPELRAELQSRGCVFRSSNGGQSWELLNRGIPPVIVMALATHPSGIIQAATYGRGVYEINVQTTLTDSQAPSPTHKEKQQ